MKEYLPIGSIVLLKNGIKKVMIYGRKQLAISTTIEYDYIACLYPEGNINNEYIYMFNNEDINKIIFRGYSDADEDAHITKLLNI